MEDSAGPAKETALSHDPSYDLTTLPPTALNNHHFNTANGRKKSATSLTHSLQDDKSRHNSIEMSCQPEKKPDAGSSKRKATLEVGGVPVGILKKTPSPRPSVKSSASNHRPGSTNLTASLLGTLQGTDRVRTSHDLERGSILADGGDRSPSPKSSIGDFTHDQSPFHLEAMTWPYVVLRVLIFLGCICLICWYLGIALYLNLCNKFPAIVNLAGLQPATIMLHERGNLFTELVSGAISCLGLWGAIKLDFCSLLLFGVSDILFTILTFVMLATHYNFLIVGLPIFEITVGLFAITLSGHLLMIQQQEVAEVYMAKTPPPGPHMMR